MELISSFIKNIKPFQVFSLSTITILGRTCKTFILFLYPLGYFERNTL